MADDNIIYCLLEGKKTPFKIRVSSNNDIGELMMNIHGVVGPGEMTLWKLHKPIPIRPFETFPDRLPPQGSNLSQHAAELADPTQELSVLFLEPPQKNHLAIIVQTQTLLQHRIGSLPPSPPLDAIKRQTTVSALYQKLNRYRFIQVRGTPASGKSTLAKLLGMEISHQEPLVHIIWVSGWNLDRVEASGGWHSYLKKNKFWKEDEDTVFIFDEAQASYADSALWNDLFKGIREYNKQRAITFASYGSPFSMIDIHGEASTPFFVADEARVSLLPIDHGDNLPVAGLFFTQTEFNELVSSQYPSPEHHFDPSFLDIIFGITQGHVGAIHDMLAIILCSDSYRALKLSGKLFTWELFQETISLTRFLQNFEHPDAGVFRRGLPSDNDLKQVPLAGVFSSVLRMGCVTNADFTTESSSNALHQCFRKGWLHSDKLDNDVVGYFFPSSLHRWYVEWKLWGIASTVPFTTDNLLQFAMEVISNFSPRILSASRRIGPGCIQRPPEAQYQDEFYRCCHILSNGSLQTFPEFGMAKGRVDFYIPAKKWGVELLRDGSKLEEHSGSFSSGSGSYGTTLNLSDYIILDCRTTSPRQRHPHLLKLYHVVFGGNHRVQVLDNMLNAVPGGDFVLLAAS